MSKPIHLLVFQFLFLVLLQALILNNIEVNGYINPYLYILFMVLLPLETPRSASLFLGFLLGLSIDFFSGTWGMHASATVFLAFCRPFVLKIMAPREGYEFGQTASIRDMGFSWFISYAAILTVLHHTFLFFVEVFRFSEILQTLGRVILSSVFTLLLILMSQYLSYREKGTT